MDKREIKEVKEAFECLYLRWVGRLDEGFGLSPVSEDDERHFKGLSDPRILAYLMKRYAVLLLSCERVQHIDFFIENLGNKKTFRISLTVDEVDGVDDSKIILGRPSEELQLEAKKIFEDILRFARNLRSEPSDIIGRSFKGIPYKFPGKPILEA